MMTSSTEREIRDALDSCGIQATGYQVSLLARHLELVVEKNRVVNLTRITDTHSAVILHVLDSLLLLSAVNEAPRGELLDLGTGAGYPGIPLAIMTERPTLLVDSVGKKAKAVEEFVDELGCDERIRVQQIRAEELAQSVGQRFSVITARAVAQANVLVEYASPLLCLGGRLVAAKGHISNQELDAGDSAASICGLRRVSRETFELPEDMGYREVIVYEKIARPRIKLPRNVGMAKHHPLGM